MICLLTALFLLLGGASAGVISLTEDNYNEMTAGKTVFIKFFAPWCGHCKKMAPDWEKLAADWKDHAVGLVAEVDCTDDESGDLCNANGVQGFPTLLYGDALALQPYQGGRSYEQLSEFAEEHLSKPVCSIFKIDACDEKTKQDIAKLSKLPASELAKRMEKVDDEISKMEEEFEAKVDELEEKFLKLEAEHEESVKKAKEQVNYSILKQLLAKQDMESDEL